MSYCDTCIHHDVCGMEGVDDEATTYCADRIEPCEDCISRKAVLDINENHRGQMPNHINHQIWQEIKDLPSVTPQPKIGRWIVTPNGFPPEPTSVCSECGFDRDFYIHPRGFDKMKFCPYCGAKMQDSEKKKYDG